MVARSAPFSNPFRPGAGHFPPYLAGRVREREEFERLLGQSTVLENVVLTGFRGVGKTVLLDTFKPLAMRRGWLWVSNDLSESVSVSEDTMALRLLTDLAVVTSALIVSRVEQQRVGFGAPTDVFEQRLTFEVLRHVFDHTPGLVSDRVRAVLEFVWKIVKPTGGGVIFAYDEAQNLSDEASDGQYPLSLLLDVFQSLQRRGVRFLLVLTGLPTLFPRLVEARTFAERMFRVMLLARLDPSESRDAIVKPTEGARSPVKFGAESVRLIVETSAGHPYFIQYICREAFDTFVSNATASGGHANVPIEAIMRKLDTAFFAGRWARATDRQRDLLHVIALLPNSDDEFTVQEVVARSVGAPVKEFGSSHANQMLVALSAAGLVYKNRHGKYSFAVPLFGQFVLRQVQ